MSNRMAGKDNISPERGIVSKHYHSKRNLQFISNMPHRSVAASRHRGSINSCTFQLQLWKPFNLIVPNPKPNPKSSATTIHLDSDSHNSSPRPPTPTGGGFTITTKRPCLANRTTSFSHSVDSIDFSKLTLFDDGPHNKSSALPTPSSCYNKTRDKFPWMARKRRRRGSRSVSGRSSTDRSVTRNGRCCSLGATATATCSDFMVAAGGTDSSGELFANGNGNCGGWASDVSEARSLKRECGDGGGGGGNGGAGGEREVSSSGFGFGFGFDAQWSESGYGSEPGYRGDGELGYGDELDEEEEEDDGSRFLFWGSERFGDDDANMEMETVEQKNHHRGRRKKQDWNGR